MNSTSTVVNGGVVTSGPVSGQKLMMNGSLQYHDVRTKIQQFEKIRAEATASATTSNVLLAPSTTNTTMGVNMSSSSVSYSITDIYLRGLNRIFIRT